MKQETNIPERTLNKKMLERLIIIHNAIKAGMYPDVPKLQKLYCEQTGYSKVGEATIYRDIDLLRTYFHAPLEFDREKGGYHYFDEKWDFALNSISTEDVFYLSAAKTLLSSFEGSPIYNSISDVINFVTDTQGVGKSSLLERIAVAPYQFLFDEGSCFLFGFSFERNAERIFSLGRIRNLEVTSEHFELPEDFDFFSRCGGGKFGIFMSDKAVDFVIDLYNDAREIVKERILADNQKVTNFEEEERTRVEFSSTQTLRVMEWILSQGSHAVPISPDWFVDNWKLTVEAMMKRVNGIFD